jgi:serine/threonine protein phosphatase PrpC
LLRNAARRSVPATYDHFKAFASASFRAKSQDAAQTFERDGVLVVAIADGGGGMRDGEAASRSLMAIVAGAVDDRDFVLEHAPSWIDLFRATDTALAANGAHETTGLVVVLGGRGLVGISTGDSEAWVVASTTVDNLTVGQHTRHRLGSRRATVTTFQRSLLAGVLVIATDGLFKYAAPDVIARIVRDNAIRAAAQGLVDLVRLRSGKHADDVAVVLVQQTEAPDSATVGAATGSA